MSNSGLEEFQQHEFEGYGPKTGKSISEDISNKVRESLDAPLVKELVLDDKLTAITIKGKGWYKSNDVVGTEESIGAGHSSKETGSSQDYILMPLWKDGSLFDSSSKNASNDEPQPSSDAGKKDDEGVNKESGIDDQERPKNSTQDVNAAGPSINTASTNVNTGSLNINTVSPTVTTAPLEATHDDFFGDETEIDMSNITTTYLVPSTPNTRIHKDHSLDHVIGDVLSGVQTRRMTNEQGFISAVYEGKTHEDLHTCLFACFLSQEEPKRVAKALSDSAWIFRNKKDERGIVIWNKARLVAQGHTQEEGIDYDEVFALVARIKAIRLFLAYASFMGFMVYQMDVKSAFLYGQIEEEVYVCQPLGFEDPDYPNKVYKVVKALYGLYQAPRAWYETLAKYLLDNGFHRGKIDQTLFIKEHNEDILLVQVYVDDIIFGSTKKELCTEFEKLMHDKFQMSSMGELTFFLGLQVKQKEDGIFISQDKYVAKILRKFSFTDVKTASTPMDTKKPLLKDSDGDDVDVHLYRSMIGSLMYLTSSRPDIMFAVCACARF
ncbi:putative ribonuclease H-like domain-containing protein [Tanacetum coccineum]